MCAFSIHPFAQQVLVRRNVESTCKMAQLDELLEGVSEIQSIGGRTLSPTCFTHQPFDTRAAGRAAGGGVRDTAAAAAAGRASPFILAPHRPHPLLPLQVPSQQALQALNVLPTTLAASNLPTTYVVSCNM